MHESLPNLMDLLVRQFPGAQIAEQDGSFTILTVHGAGTTLEQAIQNALDAQTTMRAEGRSVRSLLDSVLEDLRSHKGMSRARHDDLHVLLDSASNALNQGVLAGVIPWIQVPGLNREIEDLRRRVTTRLNMVAQEMKLMEKVQKAPEVLERRRVDRAIQARWADIDHDAPNEGLIKMSQRIALATRATPEPATA